MSRNRSPEFFRAVETGTIERYRKGENINEEDRFLVSKLLNTPVVWPDGSRTTAGDQPSQIGGKGWLQIYIEDVTAYLAS